jgi:hypothetical protein
MAAITGLIRTTTINDKAMLAKVYGTLVTEAINAGTGVSSNQDTNLLHLTLNNYNAKLLTNRALNIIMSTDNIALDSDDNSIQSAINTRLTEILDIQLP